MLIWSQLGLLVWKNLLIQWRSKLWTLFEVIFPLVILISVILLVNHHEVKEKRVATTYTSFDVSGNSYDLDRTISQFTKPINAEWFSSKYLAYCPQTDTTNELMRELESRYEGRSEVKVLVRHFNTEVEMETALTADLATSGATNWTYIGGVVFETVDSEKKQLAYKIRLPKRRQDPDWHTDGQWPVDPANGPRSEQLALPREPKYWNSAFLTVQRALDTVFIERAAKSLNRRGIDDITVGLQRLPYPSYVTSTLAGFLTVLPTLLAVVFWLPVVHTARTVAAEKEARLKEYMSVMGLRSMVYYLSHFVTAYAKVGLVAGVAGILLIPVLVHTSASLLLISLLLYAVGAVMFAMLVSSIFHSGGGAIRGAVILWLISFVLLIINQKNLPGFTGMVFYSFNINSAFYFTLRVFTIYENQSEGVGWFKLFNSPSPDNGYSLGLGLIMMIVDALWMWLLTLYLDVVYPADEAPSQPPFTNGSDEEGAFERQDADDQRHVDIDVRRLTKVWRGGWFGGDDELRAVDAVSFRACRGQVTALLGHNGAGKSTTFAMLTGLTAPTSGDALICQHSIRTDLDAVRQHLGLCPQYNTLFDKLTVREHLKLFCKLKGRVFDPEQADALLNSLELGDKADSLTMTLSGGMKRKLSLAIALIGGSEVVVLDEPTAGMDPGARHAAWTLLQKEKAERTVLLTTHYMEEADLLGDRIAILVKGQLRCMGSPLFLKNLFGTGYSVTIVLTSSASPRTADEILTVLQKHCPHAKIQSAIGQEATYLLPTTAKQRFGAMFAELESSRDRLCIASFGVSATTMEEVFLKVGDTINGDMTDAAAVAEEHAADIACAASQAIGEEEARGRSLLMSHIEAMCTKRFLYTSRHWMLLIPQLVFPIALLSLCVLVGQLIGGSKSDDIALALRPAVLTPTKFLLQDSSTEYASWFQSVVRNTSDLQLELVTDFSDFVLSRYKEMGVVAGKREMTLGAIVSPKSIYALFSGETYHSPAIALSMTTNALLQWVVSDSSAFIQTTNHPLPIVESADSATWDQVLSSQLVGLLVSLMIMPCMGLVLCAFVTLVVRERASGFKHMQVLSGLHPATYWLTTFLCDAVIVAVAIVLVLAVLLIGSVTSLTSQLPATILIFISYSWAMLPLIYCFSFVFSSPNKAYVSLVILSLITGVVAFIVFNIIAVLVSVTLANFINVVCMLLLPTYALGGAFSKLFLVGSGDNESRPTDKYVLAWNNAGQNVVMMLISGVAFWILLFAIEFGIFRFLRSAWESRHHRTYTAASESFQLEDEDVKLELQRVTQLDSRTTAMKVVDLTKCYGTFRAVNSLTFATQAEECFGLLGVNGAGKTTTFEMLAGQSVISSGDAIINNTSIKSNWRKACRSIGYCPQFDAILGELTGRETLGIIARIRGVASVTRTVDAVISAVGIKMHANKPIKKYSGGNKRRLSVGLALIGRPDVLMLDEPTAGVDPKARRLIWDVLSAVRAQGTALVLTSHSMEECEALCTRVGIMVAGSLRCLGSTQHIKSKFGGGSNLTIKLPHAHQVPAAIERVRQTLPNAVVKEVHLTQVSFNVRRTANARWSELFETVTKLAEELQVVDYSLSQCTLEQAFLELSRAALLCNNDTTGVANTFV
uniref:ABC transporter domain-containing protein n=1 Tax=Plectus sambesii TaxID=2011161 RepID=A0A914XN67_9BILA